MVGLGSGSQREIEDIALTRYACYLIAQNEPHEAEPPPPPDPDQGNFPFAHIITPPEQ